MSFLALLAVLFVVLTISLIFEGTIATADPLHWVVTFIGFLSLFTIFFGAISISQYRSRSPGARVKAYRGAAGILVLSLFSTGLVYVSAPHAAPLPWAFQGAYAQYYGKGALLDGSEYSLNVTMKALTANGIVVHLLTNTTTKFGNGQSMSYTNDSWVSATRFAGRNPLSDDQHVLRTFDASLTLQGRTIPTRAYEYHSMIGGYPAVITVYVQKDVAFTVEFGFSLGNASQIGIPVVSTNIPGLQP